MPTTTATDDGYTTESYFDLVRAGVLRDDDRVELLEGLVVASPPQGPLHAAVLAAVDEELRRAVGGRATLRVQMPLLAGPRSAPEPDLAVVPGRPFDYARRHPDSALLVVEVAESSLPQDRLTKSRIYAAAGVPEYWIVNLRDGVLEVLTRPDRTRRLYAEQRRFARGESVEAGSIAGAVVQVSALIPGD